MIEFAIWLITPDREIADKWYRRFSRERLNVRTLPGLFALNNLPQGTWGLAFVEACKEGAASPEDLKSFLNGRKNISVIVFSRPGRVDNKAISAFLESGADDFITTDMDENVLFFKAKAHIRRLLPSLNQARTVVTSRDGSLELDRERRTVRMDLNSPMEKTLDDLTPKGFEILTILLSNENCAISRKSLMEQIWQEKAGHINVETIDKHVELLRRRLGNYGRNIRTVYGTGYAYMTQPKESK